MADSNTIVPFNKFPSIGDSHAANPVQVLAARSWYGGDEWVGTADEVVAAGLVARDQLPGEPGKNKVCATYYRGQHIGKGVSAPRDENYLNITRYGRHRFIVRKGISKEEAQRRNTKKYLSKKSPEIDFDSLPPAPFSIGEKVVVGGAYVEVVDIRYECVHLDYSYRVEPNLDERYNWVAESVLNKPTSKSACIVALPGAALQRVHQTRGPGRLPKGIACIRAASTKRWCRDQELKKLRDELRSLNIFVELRKEVISEREKELFELKSKIQELLKQ